jgi:glutathione synthase
MPAAGDHRGNLAAGAKAASRPLTDRDRWLCSRIGPVMRERGMLFVGLDVIGGFVTEINVTSPTGIRELQALAGEDIAGSFIDAVLARLPARGGRK